MWVDLVGMAACTWCLCPLSKGRPQLFLFLPVWQEVSCLFWQEVWELICVELTALITWVLEDHLGEIKVFEKTSLLHLVFILSLQVQVPKKKNKGNRCWIRVLNKVAWKLRLMSFAFPYRMDYLDKEVYTNPPTAAYFMQYNTTSRWGPLNTLWKAVMIMHKIIRETCTYL